jgi:hypothetical protein
MFLEIHIFAATTRTIHVTGCFIIIHHGGTGRILSGMIISDAQDITIMIHHADAAGTTVMI